VVDPSALMLDLLNRLYPSRDGDRDLTEKAVEVEQFQSWLDDARKRRGVAEKDEKTARAGLVGLLGDGEVALIDGAFAYAYPERTRENKARPASTSTYRQLVFTAPKENA
jgi:hypothetical protein